MAASTVKLSFLCRAPMGAIKPPLRVGTFPQKILTIFLPKMASDSIDKKIDHFFRFDWFTSMGEYVRV